METFTPGPWWPGHLHKEKDEHCQCRYVLSEGYFGSIAEIDVNNGIKSIADGGNDAPPVEEAIGNMHLIAAAPELYEALKMALTKQKGWRDLARMALSKATDISDKNV